MSDRASSSSSPESPGPGSSGAGLARSAGILAVGNILSRVLGLAREMLIAAFFGATGPVSAFTVASMVPTMLYDFLVGGMLSAALVPVLSQYARPDRRLELVRLVGALVSLLAVTLAGLVLLLQWAAPQVAWLLAGGFQDLDPSLLPLTVRWIRLLAPAAWFTSMAGLLMALLYALQRFTFPALATAIYNVGIVLAVPLLAPWLDITSLVVGVLLGSSLQFAVMAWDVRRTGLRLQVCWSHPALRTIVRLYMPIAIGLVVAQFQVALDRRLASGTGVQSIAWMRNATTLQQLPLGLISVAVALAALPRLSRHFAARDEAGYRRTLAQGLRMVLVLLVPVLVGLGLLAEPVIRLLFQRGAFTAQDTVQVAQALRVYLVGAFFAGMDFPLNYAFYARNNTWLPASVGAVSVGIYAVIALALVEGMGYLGLVWADTAKQASHALIMVAMLAWTVGRLDGQVRRGLIQVGGAGLAMAGVTGGLAWAWRLSLGEPVTLLGLLLHLAVVGGGGLAVYVGVLAALRVSEVQELGRQLRQWAATAAGRIRETSTPGR